MPERGAELGAADGAETDLEVCAEARGVHERDLERVALAPRLRRKRELAAGEALARRRRVTPHRRPALRRRRRLLREKKTDG